jgi:hydrogenase nickel incorporation protein HypA/HybF
MHELSIALSLLDCAAEESDRRGGAKVLAIHVKLGALAGVVKEALLAAYEMASEISEFAGSRLVIQDIPVVAYCPQCCTEREIASVQRMCCPVCGTPTPDIRSGRELEVTALEISP